MSFNYDKFKKKDNDPGNQWASNSDLFMVLSVIFLLLYVTSSLKNGTFSIQKHIEYKQLEQENIMLNQRLDVYNKLKNEQLAQAEESEQEVYNKLMEKLSLLQEDASKEKVMLRKKAQENEEKEMALNQYQHIIRNIIDANVVAKKRIQHRDQIINTKQNTIVEKTQVIKKQEGVIAEKSQIIAEQEEDINNKQQVILAKNQEIEEKQEILKEKQKEIVDLKDDIEDKKQQINQNNLEISKINQELSKKLKSLELAKKNQKITAENYRKQMAQIKKISTEKINKLDQENKTVSSQLNEVNGQLSQVSSQLMETNMTLEEQNREKARLARELLAAQEQHQEEMLNIKSAHQNQLAKEKAAFEADLAKQKLTLAQRQKKEAEFKKQVAAKEKELQSQLQNLAGEVQQTQNMLAQTELEKGKALASLQEQKALQQKLEGEINDTKNKYAQEMDNLKRAHQDRLAKEKKAFDDQLAKEKLSASDKAKKLARFKLDAAKKQQELDKQLVDLQGKIAETAGQLQDAQKEKERAIASIDKLKSQNENLSEDLKVAQSLIDTRRKLAKQIQDQLNKVGVKTDVNDKNGEVILSLGDDYFDTGKAQVKPTMEKSLQKFMPAYAQSLFKDPKIAEKIASVEIIGFASPTYANKYVNPNSFDPEDRKAIQYNLDLSIQRANSIYQYVFDPTKLEYEHQRKLRSLVKVTGRSFFAEGTDEVSKIPSGMPQKEFCSKFDCQKAQRVIIKFNLKN